MKKLFGFLAGLVLLAGAVVAYAQPAWTCNNTGDYIPDLAVRRIYYECDASLTPVTMVCDGQLVWSQVNKTCVAASSHQYSE